MYAKIEAKTYCYDDKLSIKVQKNFKNFLKGVFKWGDIVEVRSIK